MKTWVILAGVIVTGLALGGEGDPLIPPDARPGEMGVPKVSAVRMFLYNLGNDKQVLYGDLPMMYRILGLSDQQIRDLEKICRQAKEENSALHKQSKPAAGEGYREYYRRLDRKQNEIVAKCQKRISEVLTADQKKAMEQFEALAADRRAREKEIAADAQKRMLKNTEKVEARLNQMLTEAQKKKLDELFAAKKAAMRTIAGGGRAAE